MLLCKISKQKLIHGLAYGHCPESLKREYMPKDSDWSGFAGIHASLCSTVCLLKWYSCFHSELFHSKHSCNRLRLPTRFLLLEVPFKQDEGVRNLMEIARNSICLHILWQLQIIVWYSFDCGWYKTVELAVRS